MGTHEVAISIALFSTIVAFISLLINRAKAAPQLSPGKIEKEIKRKAPDQVTLMLRFKYENTGWYPLKIKYIKFGMINFNNMAFTQSMYLNPINKVHKNSKIHFSQNLEIKIKPNLKNEDVLENLSNIIKKHCLIVILKYKGVSFMKLFNKREKYFYILEGESIADFLLKEDYDKIKKNLPSDFLY